MPIAFPKPKFEFECDVDAEIARLREWRKREDRFVPAKNQRPASSCNVEHRELRGAGPRRLRSKADRRNFGLCHRHPGNEEQPWGTWTRLPRSFSVIARRVCNGVESSSFGWATLRCPFPTSHFILEARGPSSSLPTRYRANWDHNVTVNVPSPGFTDSVSFRTSTARFRREPVALQSHRHTEGRADVATFLTSDAAGCG
jgi:hypothetical protein